MRSLISGKFAGFVFRRKPRRAALQPDRVQLAACSTASRDGLQSAARVDRPAQRPPLTRSALAASSPAQVGTKKRLRGRTKKLTRLAAAQAAMSWPNRRAVCAFRSAAISTLKATDHELQKHDKFIRYQQRRLPVSLQPAKLDSNAAKAPALTGAGRTERDWTGASSISTWIT